MGPRRGFVGITWDVGAVMGSDVDEDGVPLVQPEGYSPDGGVSAQVGHQEQHHIYGFLSRPLDPDKDPTGQVLPGGACTVLYGFDGNVSHCLLLSDPRTFPLLPPIAKGESLQYGPAANFVRCKADGSVSLFTTDDGTYDGQSVYLQVARDKFVRYSPWGIERFELDGYSLVHASGAQFLMGGIGGLPSPLGALGNYATLSAAIIKLQGAAIVLGPDLGLADPVAKSTPLMVVLTAIQASLNAIRVTLSANASGLTDVQVSLAKVQLALAAIVAIPTNSAASGAVVTSGDAILQSQTSVADAALTMLATTPAVVASANAVGLGATTVPSTSTSVT